MLSPPENLKSLLAHFVVSQQELADALQVNASQISRWISGERKLTAASPHMPGIAEYFLALATKVADIDWLKAQFAAAGLPTEATSVSRIRQNLTIWLSSDGETLRRNLGTVPPSIAPKKDKPTPSRASSDSMVQMGTLELSLALRPVLEQLPQGSDVDVFLSNDQITTTIDEGFAGLLLLMADQRGLRFRMVVCVSGNTRFMSALLNTYMGALVSGHVQLSVVHGMTQTVTNQLHIILPGLCAVLVTETTGSAAPPVAVFVTQPSFVEEMKNSFDAADRYAQPILNIYGDDYSRNILEIIYMEFCTPGALDVVKDSVNPMYMTPKGYDRFLKTRGHSAEEYAWRSAEYVRFKKGLDETLQGGAVFREIISLSRLNDMAKNGSCRMSGLYFMQSGYVDLDGAGCVDILNGYIHYLETAPSFHLMIVDDFSSLNENNCWQLKQNHHLAVNCWSGPEPVMIHSDQLMLLREFQAHFDALWEQGQRHLNNRASVVAILRDVAARIHLGE